MTITAPRALMLRAMDWATTILDLILGIGAGTALGYVLGKRAKLRELHQLQDEGYLTITYSSQLTGGTASGGGSGPTIHELLHAEQEGEPELERVRYERRDREERRDDWARALKARQLAAKAEPDEPEH